MNTHLDTRIPQPPLDDQHRQRLRVAVWAVLGGSSLALAGIFGFGALTGAGDYFSDDEAEQAAALAEHYWQIWGLLLPVAIAIVFSGVALFMFAGSLAPITEGWRATVVTWIRRVIVPLAVVASVPYWFGPELDELGIPGWVEVVTASCGILAYAATVMLGVAMLVRPLPTWTGIAMIVGGILAAVSFLPLFAFAGTLLAGMGLLRWSRPTSAVIAPCCSVLGVPQPCLTQRSTRVNSGYGQNGADGAKKPAHRTSSQATALLPARGTSVSQAENAGPIPVIRSPRMPSSG